MFSFLMCRRDQYWGKVVLRAGIEGETYFVDSAEIARGIPELDAMALSALPATLEGWEPASSRAE